MFLEKTERKPAVIMATRATDHKFLWRKRYIFLSTIVDALESALHTLVFFIKYQICPMYIICNDHFIEN